MTLHDPAHGAAMAQLWPALAASIALHAALLAGLPDVWTFTAPPIVARLNAWIEPGVTPVASPANSEAPAPKPAAAPRAQQSTQPVPAAPAARSESRETLTRVEAPRVQEQPADERVAIAAASPSAIVKSGPEAAPPVAAAAAGEGAPDLGSLAQYRLALIGAAKRHKLYPSDAIERGWQGRVDVRLVLGANGELAGALVRRSSGHDMLDRQALEMMRKAAALTPIPPALRNREFAIEVPVLFELKSES